MGKEKDIIKEHFQGRWQEFYAPFVDGLKKDGRDYTAKCPFHEETVGSFKIAPETGIYNCFGCGMHGDPYIFWSAKFNMDIRADFPKILEGIIRFFEIHMAEPQCEVATYPYRDADGHLLYEIVRLGPEKDFRARPGVLKEKRILYNLPNVSKADIVIVVEGEKDTDALADRGMAVTTSPFGANAEWLPQYTESLEGKIVILIPDRDPAGEEHMKKIAKAIYGVAKRIYWLDLLEGKDVSDCLASMPSMAEELKDFVSRLRRNEPLEDIEGTIYKSFSLRTQQGRNSNTSEDESFKNEWLDDYNSLLRATCRNNSQQEIEDSQQSNYSRVLQFFEEHPGWVRISDLSRWFEIRDNIMRVYLGRACKAGLLERHPNEAGRFRRIISNIGFVDVQNIDLIEDTVDFKYPGGLEEFVETEPGGIFTIGGETASGKTSYLINLIRRNDDKHKINFISTEMDRRAINQRLRRFENDSDPALRRAINEWRFDGKRGGFQEAIGLGMNQIAEKLIPGWVNIVDWVQLTQDDYANISAAITGMKARVGGNGLLIVALQKDPDKPTPRGRWQSIEGAYLAITLSKTGNPNERILEVIKSRSMVGGFNPEGMKIPYRPIENKGKLQFQKPIRNTTTMMVSSTDANWNNKHF